MHHDNQSDSRVLPDSSIPTTETTRGWLRNTLSLLVDHPDDVRVEASDGQASAVFEAFVNPVDVRRVIGKGGRRIPADRALSHVLGYTCANDVSERVIQKSEMDQGALLVGKGYDTFCPLGPVIATDVDPADIRIGARVNGEQRQESSTSDLLFSVAELVAYLSTAITLMPGDVIITGTPSGVGPVVPGDHVEIFADGIGVLDALGIAAAHVLGISMGGMIVQQMALDHPGRLLSAIIVSKLVICIALRVGVAALAA